MRILIVDNPCRVTPMTTMSESYYRKLLALAGTWQEVETDFLFVDQFNIAELRVFARDVAAIESDIRPGSYKSYNSGEWFRTYKEIPEELRKNVGQFRPIHGTAVTMTLVDIPETEEAVAVAETLRKELQSARDYSSETTYQALKIVFPAEKAPAVVEGLSTALGLTENDKNYAKVALAARRAFTCDELSFCRTSDYIAPRPDAFKGLGSPATRDHVRRATQGLVREWNKYHSKHALQVDNVIHAHHLLRMLTVGRDPETEHMAALFLDVSGKIQSWHVWDGSQRSITISANDLLRKAIAANAVKIVIGHNHPSGNTQPSGSDIELTKTVQQACDILGMVLVDHLIVGASETEFTSMWTQGLITQDQTTNQDE